MRNLKSIIATTVLGLVALTANAQNPEAEAEAQALGYKPQPYTFVQVQGGVNKVFSPGSKFNPTFSVGVGRMFSNIVGARLHFNGIETKNGLKSIGANYKFKYITGNVDLMLNVFNIFKATNKRFVDLYLIGGIGANLAWGNKDFSNIVNGNRNAVAAGTATAIQEDISNAWGPGTTRKQLLNHNIRFGVLADFNIHKNFSIGVEVDLNSLDDRFNSKFNNSDDWMLTAQLSLTYKFGHKRPDKPKTVVVSTPPVAVRDASDIVTDKAASAAAAVIAVAPISGVITYTIRTVDITKAQEATINKVVDWYKQNPNVQKQIIVEGYADKGTGKAPSNMKFSQQRADNVAKALQEKGIPLSDITVKAYGDTVQPFAENDKNRAVIIKGDAKK